MSWFGIRVTNSSVEIYPSADNDALWREMCRRDRFRPRDITRPPTDWRLFLLPVQKRRNLLKNPSADGSVTGKDLKYWAGKYGIRITNSSVEICPSALV
ncbi:hypothetical protein ANANG_G00228960 [Anguilla anguilla]|uniref:Uncharacterized protein n=1 Tax=Anguilla anguilla TaxID=7936 RepID=A0A9D3RQX3_ANGAN|nr:hypothetical protein ANANG_G00228960 [Anguilla anguilla]